MIDHLNIGVIGLGYVGLPLALEFGKKYRTVGFDIKAERISQLRNGIDVTKEVDDQDFVDAKNIVFESDIEKLKKCNFYIVTVPTPIDEFKRPDLNPLISASTIIAKIIDKNDIVVFESTVYPGATEEDCVPLIEQHSGLVFNQDFFVGYSPERINPGDKTHRLVDIEKVTSGSTPETAQTVDDVYRSIINVGTYKASSIKVAEAAKVIENTQRDVNIALINELAIMFDKLGIDTEEVLEAAGTKWNFLPFRPGLVGGHCIGVDPYYLTHKAQSLGYHPEMIMAGRRLNDSMSSFVVSKLIKEMLKKSIELGSAKVLVMGLTFKEDCPDLRNSKVIDVVTELQELGISVDVMDPVCCADSAKAEYGIELQNETKNEEYDAAILAVKHKSFQDMGVENIRKMCREKSVIYDLKSLFDKQHVDIRL